ncbi:Variable major protein, partial (plasmid) [Borrelia nietonii YOR]
KSGDKRSKVGEHFERIKKGLGDAKDKLKELSGEISEAKNANRSSIEVVKSAIKGAGDVFDKLIDALTKLAGVAKEAGDTNIGDAGTNGAAGAVAADKTSVDAVIAEVKNIIETATNSGVKINTGNAGAQVANGNGPQAIVHNAQAAANSGPALATEVAKADPWAIIDKIKNATAAGNATAADAEAGALAIGGNSANAAGTAKTNADLTAAVALKAMTKGGKFTQPAANEEGAVKAAAASAVNKVLGVLDVIISKAVNLELGKIKEAVKGIKYSETTGEATESDTAQPTNKSSN